MFKHEKQLFHPVEVERPNPQYAVLLQEQLGGGNGELKAAMQYMSQSFRIKDPEIKDLFLDIAAVRPDTGRRNRIFDNGIQQSIGQIHPMLIHQIMQSGHEA